MVREVARGKAKVFRLRDDANKLVLSIKIRGKLRLDTDAPNFSNQKLLAFPAIAGISLLHLGFMLADDCWVQIKIFTLQKGMPMH